MGGLGPKMEGFPTPGQEVPGFSVSPIEQPDSPQQLPNNPPEEIRPEIPQTPDILTDEPVVVPVEPELGEKTTEIPVEIIDSKDVTVDQSQAAFRNQFNSFKEND